MLGDFVILAHRGCGADHVDLMLDTGDVLRTWQVEVAPFELAAGQVAAAKLLPDHRRVYLDYEGPISRGRGHVHRVMAGQYELAEETPERLTFSLVAEAAGTFQLDRKSSADAWRLTRLA